MVIDMSDWKKDDFVDAFAHYWYKIKPLSARLRDSMVFEEKVCSDFFEALVFLNDKRTSNDT